LWIFMERLRSPTRISLPLSRSKSMRYSARSARSS
jgi:hypothetical protein